MKDVKDRLIEKQRQYIKYLKRAIYSESIINNITIGPRNKYDSEIAELEKQLQEPELTEISFRREVAEELSRDELIERLCDMNNKYTEMREEWFEETQMKKPELCSICKKTYLSDRVCMTCTRKLGSPLTRK